MRRKWRRWAGPRSELVRAVELASDILAHHSGLPSSTDLTVEQAGDTTITSADLSALAEIHRDDLHHIESITVRIRPDREARFNRDVEARRGGNDPPEVFDGDVSIRIWKYGTSLEVEGTDRTAVEGLTQRLADALGHAATNAPGVDRPLFASITFGVAVLVLENVLLELTRAIGIAHRDNQIEATETGALVVTFSLAFAIAAGVYWLFPGVELVDDGQPTRARRSRAAMISAALAIGLGVIASALYAALGG